MFLRPYAIHIGVVSFNNAELLQKLPPQYHKWLLLFDAKKSEKLPNNEGCHNRTEVVTAEGNLRMEPIYQLTFEELRLLEEYLCTMIQESKVGQTLNSIGRSRLFEPKPDCKQSRLCVDYRHLNQNATQDTTPLPIMQ